MYDKLCNEKFSHEQCTHRDVMRNKAEKFRQLAEKRVNKALHGIRLVANLSNRNNYEYTENEAQKIISVLEGELKALRSKFTAEGQSRKRFKL